MVINKYYLFLTIKHNIMNTLPNRLRQNFFNKVILTVFSFFLSIYAFAQDATKKVEIDIDTNSGNGFFGSPWIWVVGIAVFILLLVALLRGNGRRSDA